MIQDLADGLVLRRGLPKKDADVFVRSVFEIIGEYLQTDKIVKVKGLGTFKLVTVDSRESVDVNTGERIVIKKYTKINFTPDPVLRDAVNKPFAQFETQMKQMKWYYPNQKKSFRGKRRICRRKGIMV